LLQVLDISGCSVTIDAMGCQKEVAAKIIERGGDYVLALKANHKGLAEDVTTLFEWAHSIHFEALRHDTAKHLSKGHGRVEIRQCWSISDLTLLRDWRHADAWKHLRSVVMVQATRQTGANTTVETRYYLSSLDQSARQILQATRAHWGVENHLHWVLDVTFNEDRCRVRKDHAPANLAVLLAQSRTKPLAQHHANEWSRPHRR
jgi:predicted transposase YbfD/YdcC